MMGAARNYIYEIEAKITKTLKTCREEASQSNDKVRGEQIIKDKPCPSDTMEIFEFKSVMTALLGRFSYQKYWKSQKSLTKNKSQRIKLKHFLRWYCSGQQEISFVFRLINEVKMRTDGFLFSGLDTFRKIHSGPAEGPIAYHNNNLKLKLN